MKAIICGDRNWSDFEAIKTILERHKVKIVVNGGASGADTLAVEAAKALRLPYITYEADWKKYGNAAGPIRNKEMLKERPDIVIAFHDNFDQSKGTKNMIKQAWYKKINIVLYHHKGKKIVQVPSIHFE